MANQTFKAFVAALTAPGALTGSETWPLIQSADDYEVSLDTVRAYILTLVDALEFPAAVSVASATTADIGAALSNLVNITGTTTITGLGTVASGAMRLVRFAGILTLTHNATSLILPGARNIITAANDVAIFVSEGSGNWRCWFYRRAAIAPPVSEGWQIAGSGGAQVSLTGSTSETVLKTINIPAGALGPNGQIRVSALTSAGASNANAKTVRWRMGAGIGGTTFQSYSLASTLTAEVLRRIANQNSQSVQVTSSAGLASFTQAGSPVAPMAIDTSAAFDITITGQLASAGDTMNLDSYLVEYIYGA